MMMNLKDRDWVVFPLSEIFIINPGKRLTKNDMIPGLRPFIGATDTNNGITAFVSNVNASLDSNVLGINYNGSVVETFYHPYECIFSDDVKRFRLKHQKGNHYIYLFLKTIIIQQKKKYAYGYKFTEKRMKRQNIILPVVNLNAPVIEPDWKFMEDYIRERESQLICRYMGYSSVAEENMSDSEMAPLKDKIWSAFYLKDIFDEIERGKRLKSADHIEGNTPYVSSSAMNNGVNSFISNSRAVRVFSDCLTVANSGSVGKAFYHHYRFIASDHVTSLKNPDLNYYTYLFLAPLISRLEEKYNFNREINNVRIEREIVLLPVDENSKPDWTYMEQYTKSIIRMKISSYLGYIGSRCRNESVRDML